MMPIKYGLAIQDSFSCCSGLVLRYDVRCVFLVEVLPWEQGWRCLVIVLLDHLLRHICNHVSRVFLMFYAQIDNIRTQLVKAMAFKSNHSSYRIVTWYNFRSRENFSRSNSHTKQGVQISELIKQANSPKTTQLTLNIKFPKTFNLALWKADRVNGMFSLKP